MPLRITNEDIRDFFLSGCIYNTLTKEKREQYMTLYERATKTTSHLTGMPSGGSADHNLVLANLVDAANSSERWWAFLRMRRDIIRSFLDEVTISEFYKEILLHRYVYGMGWDAMSYALRKFDKPSILVLKASHERALQECADWVNITGRYKKEILAS